MVIQDRSQLEAWVVPDDVESVPSPPLEVNQLSEIDPLHQVDQLWAMSYIILPHCQQARAAGMRPCGQGGVSEGPHALRGHRAQLVVNMYTYRHIDFLPNIGRLGSCFERLASCFGRLCGLWPSPPPGIDQIHRLAPSW